MKLTITLSEEEKLFLESLQRLINSTQRFGQEKCTIEEVVHECIKTTIFLGAQPPDGQE
jgi:hypothetical protein